MALMEVYTATNDPLSLGHVVLQIQLYLKCLWLIEMMYETSRFSNMKINMYFLRVLGKFMPSSLFSFW